MENRNKRQMNIIKSWFLERINNIDKTVIETDLEKKKIEFIRNVRYDIIINYTAIEKIKMSCFEKIC